MKILLRREHVVCGQSLFHAPSENEEVSNYELLKEISDERRMWKESGRFKRERENVSFGWFKRQRAGMFRTNDNHRVRLIKERLNEQKNVTRTRTWAPSELKNTDTTAAKTVGFSKMAQVLPPPFPLDISNSFYFFPRRNELPSCVTLLQPGELYLAFLILKGGWQLEFIFFYLKSIFTLPSSWTILIEFRSPG